MKKKKNYTKKKVFYENIKTAILFIIVIVFSNLILTSQWEPTKINQLSASYISLNNPETTDMLKVTNLSKLSDKKGISNYNKSEKTFKMTGQRDCEYKIVLYHIGRSIDEEYVKFYLVNEKGITINGNLNQQTETYDGGRVLFVGNMTEGQNWTLKMWVNKEYKKTIKNVSYEIRIKQVR